MIGHVAPAVHPMDSDTAMCQFLGSPEQILCVAFAAKGEGVGMFEQKQGWRTRPSRDLRGVFILQFPGAFVVNEADVEDL